ncbi:MAG: T9SS type A sorting domain-containing protein [Chitinophagales bacterium]
MSKYSTLPEKLKSYSLLAGSIVASSFVAQAQIIYTDVNPDVELGGTVPVSYPEVSSYNIDMNHDGEVDFKINVNIKAPLDGAFSFNENMDAASNPSNLIHSYTIEYAAFAFKDDLGDSIPFGPSFYGFNNVNFAFQTAGAISYVWNNQVDKYVAVRFQDGVDNYFGWVRLDVNTNGSVPNIVIKEFAYEQTPGDKIAAGDTGQGLPVVGIHQLMKALPVSISPNPTSGNVVISLQESLQGPVEISLRDALGREVYVSKLEMTPQQKELPFNFSDFAPGAYFIQVKSSSASFTQKLIKQ